MASKTRLLVKEAFGDYKPGARITDPAEMKAVAASHPDYVLREPVPPAEPAPARASAKQTLAPPATEAAAETARVTDHKLND